MGNFGRRVRDIFDAESLWDASSDHSSILHRMSGRTTLLAPFNHTCNTPVPLLEFAVRERRKRAQECKGAKGDGTARPGLDTSQTK